jgi:hypothetical protein
MPKIDFSMIDAKESPIVGIDAEYPRNIDNATTIAQAEAMYLNGLLELQQKVRAQFEHRLVENKGKDDIEESEAADVHYDLLKGKLNPGTGNLWYS